MDTQGQEYLTTKVTKIGKRYHIRLINTLSGAVLDEIACAAKGDIGYCCHYVLRWHDKCGGTSPMAWAARKRNMRGIYPLGDITYPAALVSEKIKRMLAKEKKS